MYQNGFENLFAHGQETAAYSHSNEMKAGTNEFCFSKEKD